jgi:hypothetical protein
MTSTNRRSPGLALILISLAAGVLFLAYPNFVIRPDRPQGAGELQAALFVLRYQHIAELLSAALALIGLALNIRSKPERKLRFGVAAAASAVFLFAALSFVNIYEILFHPAGAPSFQSARETQLDGDALLLAVNLSEPRAYPIRTLAYHHIVNDVVSGVPIAVTY